jgi:hypothetical protein
MYDIRIYKNERDNSKPKRVNAALKMPREKQNSLGTNLQSKTSNDLPPPK